MFLDTGPPVWDLTYLEICGYLYYEVYYDLALLLLANTFDYYYPYPETGLTLSLFRSIPDTLYGPMHVYCLGHTRRTMLALGILCHSDGALSF